MNNNQNQESIKASISAHKKLKKLDAASIDEFSTIIIDSGLSYEDIREKLNFFLKRNELPFRALEKAITSIQSSRWREERIQWLKKNPDQKSYEILDLKLKPSHQSVAFAAYALCIEPWKDSTVRKSRFTPHIFDPVGRYDHLRHDSSHVNLRTTPSHKSNARVKAYKLLTNAGKEIIVSEGLNSIEILIMATCIAENALEFTLPLHHPLSACHHSIKASWQPPEHALFQGEGVCNNIAGIAYNFALALGFKAPLFLARHNMHVYLETQINNQWYHFHPLNKVHKGYNFVRINDR